MPFCNRVPEQEAAVVTKLRAAGTVLLGEAMVGALAFDERWYGGRTRKSCNLDDVASGFRPETPMRAASGKAQGGRSVHCKSSGLRHEFDDFASAQSRPNPSLPSVVNSDSLRPTESGIETR